MKITENEVLHVAKLARLELRPGETVKFRKELNSILEYMDMLAGLDTAGVEPMSHTFPVTNAFRPDTAVESQDVSEALLNAPEHKDGSIVVPKVIE